MSDHNLKELDDFDFENDDFDIIDDTDKITAEDLIKEREQQTVQNAISNYDKAIDEQQEIEEESVNVNADLEVNTANIDNQQKVKESETPAKKYILYVLTDRLTSNSLQYFRSAGLPVTRIFNNIDDIRDELIMLLDPCRLVIIETGLGKFTSVNSRKDIIDMLGISDEDNKIAVFYTDNALRADARESLDDAYKRIDWFKYSSTAETVARLLLMKEQYIDKYKPSDNDLETEEDILNRVALNINTKKSKITMAGPGITIEQIAKNLDSDEYEHLKEYKVKY